VLSGDPLAGEPGFMGSFHLDIVFAGLSRWPAFSCSQERGLLGQTEPSLMYGGRTTGKHSEVFVAFDVAKKKHTVAIAEGGRRGEVRFLGDVENSPLPIDRTIGRLADQAALKPGRSDTGFIARSRRSAMIVWWSLRP
jgi:hypothetical protein